MVDDGALGVARGPPVPEPAMSYPHTSLTPAPRPPKVWCPWCDGKQRTLEALKAHNLRASEDGERVYRWTR